MKKLFKKISSLIPFVPLTALAATPPSPITTVQGLVNLLCTTFGWLFYGLIALSVVMIVIAGYNYVTAGDNSEKVSKANKMILYAAVGIAVALIAKAVPLIVSNFLGGGSTTGITTCQ